RPPGCGSTGAALCAPLAGAGALPHRVPPSVPTRRSSDLGLPARPEAVAVSVLVPAVVLKVHEVAAAIPSVPVVTGVVGVTVPLPAAAANVTATPETGLPLASLTIAEGGGLSAVPAGADVPPALWAMDTAAPALSAIAPELTGVIPVPPKL